jgi:hypothetical protein
VVRANLPFSLLGNEDLHSMFTLCKPDIAMPSAGVIKREIMRRYQEEGGRMADSLCQVDSKISITLDCWTSPNAKAFLGVTAHYINAQWVSRSLVLEFLPLRGAHTGENLCEALMGVFKKVEVLPNILGVTSDNAGNMNTLLVQFERKCRKRGVFFDKNQQHVRCVLHALNLSVQKLLDKLEAKAVDNNAGPNSNQTPAAQANQLSCVIRLRNLITAIRNSPQLRRAFYKQCGAHNMRKKELIRDVRTRWGSTYSMLRRACEFREPLSDVLKLNPGLTELSDEEWGLVEVSIQLVEPFSG